MNRRGFLRFLGGAAAAVMVPMPKKSYFLFGANVRRWRPFLDVTDDLAHLRDDPQVSAWLDIVNMNIGSYLDRAAIGGVLVASPPPRYFGANFFSRDSRLVLAHELQDADLLHYGTVRA